MFGKILLGTCLLAQLVFGQILDEDFENKRPGEKPDGQRLLCQSNNDPHMVNFWNEHYEYQVNVNDKCLHQSKYYQVSASFHSCKSTATCNCGVKISIAGTTEQAFIDNCGGSTTHTDEISLSSSPFTFTCTPQGSFNPLDEADWATLPSSNANAYFACVIVDNKTYIKTKFSSTNENVIVEIFPNMDSLYVHASYSFTASPTPNVRCLCERKTDLIGHELNLIEELPNEIDKCKDTLLNGCFEILQKFKHVLSPKRIEEIERLIANCASDVKIGGGEIELGSFQANEIQFQIKEALLEAAGKEQGIEFLRTLCKCQLKNTRNIEIIEICNKFM